MGPLTERLPKPLAEAGGKALIVHQIERLADAGIRHIVVNIAHLADQFEPALGDGSRWGVNLVWSREPDGALETGGGIRHALTHLDEDTFIVTNGDVFIDLDYAAFDVASGDLANLVLVDNPDFHPAGDFWLRDGRTSDGWSTGAIRLTFAGVGAYHRDLFKFLEPGHFPLAPLLRNAMDNGRVGGVHHQGHWMGVDTPERLAELDKHLQAGR